MSNNMHYTYIVYTTYRRCRVLDVVLYIRICIYIYITREKCVEEECKVVLVKMNMSYKMNCV